MVDVKPDGAEVRLDGEFAGHTPLTLSGLAPGAYELEIRKPNFESFSTPLSAAPGARAVFSGFELPDKILGMLKLMVEGEPQRVANYLELGQYYFVCGRKEDAVRLFKKAYDVLLQPLNFDGPGFSGKQNMSAKDMEAEQRQREDDLKRFFSEMKNPRYYELGLHFSQKNYRQGR